LGDWYFACFFDGLRLFEDFFLHEMFIAVFLGLFEVPVDGFDVKRNWLVLKGEEFDLGWGEFCTFVVVEVDDLFCVFDKSGYVRGEKVFVVGAVYSED